MGRKNIGLTFDWDYKGRKVHLSMPGYVETDMQQFQHKTAITSEDQLYQHITPNYGSRQKYTEPEDEAPNMDESDKTFLHQVTGTLLYFLRAVDITMLVSLSAIALEQSNPTNITTTKSKQFLNYAASHQDVIVTHHASDMILACYSDASYLTKPNASSRSGGHLFLLKNDETLRENGALLNIAQIIKVIMTLAEEE